MNTYDKYKDLTILIVEDNKDTRDTLISMVELDFKYVYAAKDGCEGLEMFHQHKPDILLIDIQMPCMNGMEMLVEVRKSSDTAVSIFLSAYSDVDILLKAIDLKIDAYIIKPFSYQNILQKLDENLSKDRTDTKVHTKLSKREFEVFIDISKGIKPVDIALKYEVKAKTIGTYRKRILEKLNLHSNADLIRYAIKQNLL